MLIWIVRNGAVHMYKMDLALKNIQELICHTAEPNQNSIHYCLSSSSSHWDNTEFPDSLSLSLPPSLSLSLAIRPNHRTFVANILDSNQCPYRAGVSLSCAATTRESMHSSLLENVTYKFFSNFPVVFRMSCSSYWFGRWVAIQLLFCDVLLRGFVQNNT